MGSGPVGMSFTLSRVRASIAVTVPASRLVTKAIRSPASAISWCPAPVGMVATTLELSVSITVTPPLPAVPGVVAHPEAAAVGLEDEAHRLLAGRDAAHHLEGLRVHHRDLPGLGQGEVEPLLVRALGPVGGGTLQDDGREEAGAARHADDGVDDRDAGVLVQHEEVVAVQVDHGPDAHASLEVEGDLVLAGPLLAGLPTHDPRHVHPRRRLEPRHRAAARGVRHAEPHVGVLPLDERLAARALRGLDGEVHHDAVADDPRSAARRRRSVGPGASPRRGPPRGRAPGLGARVHGHCTRSNDQRPLVVPKPARSMSR